MATNPVITPYATNFRPGWIGDFIDRNAALAGGAKVNAATFAGEEAILVKVTANRAVDAVEVAVTALSGPIPSGTTLYFGGKKYATLTAAAAAGATSLAVSALATALVTNDQTYYTPTGIPKRIASGRIVGCTFTEIEAAPASGMNWGQAVDGDDIVYIIIDDVPDADKNNDINLYRHGRIVYVNNLPGWATLSGALKAKIRAAYECSVAAPGAEVPAS